MKPRVALLCSPLLVLLAACATSTEPDPVPEPTPVASEPVVAPAERTNPMSLGAFSVSLAVKDLSVSRAFYEKLGFTQFGGVAAQNWLIMQNGSTTIGLFQGMFPNNILTFNPGWDSKAQGLADFKDVRDIQAELQAKGLTMQTAADPASTGPASLVVVDPDGNAILMDQHVPRPSK